MDRVAEEAIRCRELRALVETLDDDFDEASGGYAQFADHRFPTSDIIGRSAQGRWGVRCAAMVVQ